MKTPTTPIYTLTLNQNEVDLLGAALGKLPLEQSFGIWLKLKNQVDAAVAVAANTPVEKVAEKVENDANPVNKQARKCG
jgi:hypothetical protein